MSVTGMLLAFLPAIAAKREPPDPDKALARLAKALGEAVDENEILRADKHGLVRHNDWLRAEVSTLRAENEALRDELDRTRQERHELRIQNLDLTQTLRLERKGFVEALQATQNAQPLRSLENIQAHQYAALVSQLAAQNQMTAQQSPFLHLNPRYVPHCVPGRSEALYPPGPNGWLGGLGA